MTAIDWPAFLLVLAGSLVTAVVTVSLFATGVRLLATPPPGLAPDVEPDPDDQDEDDPTTPTSSRPGIATAGAVAVFVLAGACAVGGVLLIIH